jgi:peptidoglycan/LPS O-acetylase OafA/YrhL
LALTSCSIAVLIGLASYYAIERPINKSGWLARLAGVQSKAMIGRSAEVAA